MEELLDAIEKIAEHSWNEKSVEPIPVPEDIEDSILTIENDLRSIYPDLPNTRWIALRLLEGDVRIREALENNEFEEMATAYNQPPLDLNQQLANINEGAK